MYRGGLDLVSGCVAHSLEHFVNIENASGLSPGFAAEFFPIFCYSNFDIILMIRLFRFNNLKHLFIYCSSLNKKLVFHKKFCL